MKLRNILAFGASLAVLIGMLAGTHGTAYAQGQGGFGARAGRRESPLMVAIKAASVTDAQEDQIKTISQKYRDQLQELRKSSTPDAGAAATPSARPQVSPETRAKMTELEDKQAAEVKAILTPEQQPKFQAAYDAAKAEQASNAVFGGVMQQLELTDEQKAKIAPILKDATPELTKLRADTTMDRKAKNEKTMEIWTSLKEKIRPILTADQQKKLDDIKNLRGGGNRGGARRGGQAPATK